MLPTNLRVPPPSGSSRPIARLGRRKAGRFSRFVYYRYAAHPRGRDAL